MLRAGAIVNQLPNRFYFREIVAMADSDSYMYSDSDCHCDFDGLALYPLQRLQLQRRKFVIHTGSYPMYKESSNRHIYAVGKY